MSVDDIKKLMLLEAEAGVGSDLSQSTAGPPCLPQPPALLQCISSLLSLYHDVTSSGFTAEEAVTLPLLLDEVFCRAEVLPLYPHPFLSQQDTDWRHPLSRCVSDQYQPPNPHIHPSEWLQNQSCLTPNFLHHAANSLWHSPVLRAKPSLCQTNQKLLVQTCRSETGLSPNSQHSWKKRPVFFSILLSLYHKIIFWIPSPPS